MKRVTPPQVEGSAQTEDETLGKWSAWLWFLAQTGINHKNWESVCERRIRAESLPGLSVSPRRTNNGGSADGASNVPLTGHRRLSRTSTSAMWNRCSTGQSPPEGPRIVTHFVPSLSAHTEGQMPSFRAAASERVRGPRTIWAEKKVKTTLRHWGFPV